MAKYLDTITDESPYQDPDTGEELDSGQLGQVVRQVIEHHNVNHPGVWRFCDVELCREVALATGDR